MRRKIFLIWNFVFLLLAASCSKDWNAPAEPPNPDENQYRIINGEAMVAKLAYKSEVKIPPTVERGGITYPVTIIGKEACNEEVKTLYVPASIKMMYGDSFIVNNIENLYIEDFEAWCNISFNLTDTGGNHTHYYSFDANPINRDANVYFGGQKVGDVLTIPSEIKNISAYAFRYLNIKNLVLNDEIEQINDGVFYGCNNLAEIHFGKNIKKIGKYSFAGLGMKELRLPEGIEQVGLRAFSSNSLKSVSLPETLTKIGGEAFGKVSVIKIKSLEGWMNVKYYDYDGSILNPEASGWNIEPYTASYTLNLNGENIKNLVLPESLTVIPSLAFYYCDLEEVTLHEGIVRLGLGSFNHCDNLKSVTLPGSIVEMSSFNKCENLTTVKLEEGITKFENSFQNCPKLSSLYLPSTITYCNFNTVLSFYTGGNENFNLKEIAPKIYLYAKNPPALAKMNYEIPEGVILYVPEESLELYKTAKGWSDFPHIEPIK